jgi:hypothetical protein
MATSRKYLQSLIDKAVSIELVRQAETDEVTWVSFGYENGGSYQTNNQRTNFHELENFIYNDTSGAGWQHFRIFPYLPNQEHTHKRILYVRNNITPVLCRLVGTSQTETDRKHNLHKYAVACEITKQHDGGKPYKVYQVVSTTFHLTEEEVKQFKEFTGIEQQELAPVYTKTTERKKGRTV